MKELLNAAIGPDPANPRFRFVVIDFDVLVRSKNEEWKLLGQECQKIGTRFNVSPNCQEILLAAGEAAVRAVEGELRGVVTGVFSEP